MNLDDVMRLPRYHRRTFVSLVTLIVAGLLVVDVVFLADERTLQAAISDIIRNIAAGVVTAVIVIIFLGLFIPKGESDSSIDQIPPLRITHEFDKLLDSTDRWHFQGNFGRNLRSKVLPYLAKRRSGQVYACIIDPSDTDLCHRHARFRSEIPAIDGSRDFTPEEVACKALVTILLCASYSVRTRLQIDLWLLKTFSPIRVDSTDDGMLITVEDRRSPALRISRDNFLFDHFMMHMFYNRQQGRKLDLRGFPDKPLDTLDTSELVEFISSVGLGNVLELTSADTILDALKKDENPYARS